MDKMKTALDTLNQSLKKLEDAVVCSKSKQSDDAAKIEQLHDVIATAYARVDQTLAKLKGDS